MIKNAWIETSKSKYITTIACGVICEYEDKILMVREIKEGRIVWNQPVGHLDPGETLTEAAIRETWEETGLKVELVGLIGTYLWQVNSDRAALRFCFLAKSETFEVAPVHETEIMSAEWVTREQLKQISSEFRTPITQKCLDDYFLGKLYPLESVTSILSFLN